MTLPSLWPAKKSSPVLRSMINASGMVGDEGRWSAARAIFAIVKRVTTDIGQSASYALS
jgi:hypothetical protein